MNRHEGGTEQDLLQTSSLLLLSLLLLLLLLLYPLFNQVSLIEFKIYFTRETWPSTAVHSYNIKHKKKYKVNIKCNCENTL